MLYLTLLYFLPRVTLLCVFLFCVDLLTSNKQFLSNIHIFPSNPENTSMENSDTLAWAYTVLNFAMQKILSHPILQDESKYCRVAFTEANLC